MDITSLNEEEINASKPLLDDGYENDERLGGEVTVDSSAEIQEDLEDEELKKTKNTVLGMILVALGTGLFCSIGAVVQYHGGSVLQLMLGRFFVQFLISLVVWTFRKPAGCVSWYGDPPYRTNLFMRGIFYWFTTFCWWRGLELVPIGDGEAILFLSPILTVVASRVLLKEELPKSFAFTILLTLAGLVFVCQPGFIFSASSNYHPMSWRGLLFLIGADCAWSSTCVLVRTAKEASWLQLEMVSTVQSVFLWTPLVILVNQLWWHNDDLSGGGWDFKLQTFGMMALVGSLGFTALMMNVIGYQIGDATKVAWMEYLDLVFAFLYQWLAFGEVPNTWEFIGCACLVGTCGTHFIEAYLKYLEKRNQQAQNAIEGEAEEVDSAIEAEEVGEKKPLLESFNFLKKSRRDAELGDNNYAMKVLDKIFVQKVTEKLEFSNGEGNDSASDMDHKK